MTGRLHRPLRRARRGTLAALLAAAALIGLGPGPGPGLGLGLGLGATPARAQGVTVSISCGAVGPELEVCREGAEIWAERTGNRVNVVSTPNSTTERLALYQQLLNAGAGDIDVFQIDVIHPGLLGSHFVDLAPRAGAETGAFFDTLIVNNTVDGALIALPWFVDAGLLYYRTDLLEQHGLAPPRTWQELTAQAAAIQEGERAAGNDRFWGFVWQGRAYEGLTCNALEWIDSFGGGTIVANDGRITVNNPRAIAAVDLAAGWVGAISPDGVLNYTEEEARGVFQTGNAAFMRNWPYAWGAAQSPDSPIRGRVGVIPLPRGGPEGKASGTLGGWQLAVSKYSDHVEQATDLVLHLTGREEQKRRALSAFAAPPTRVDLYRDSEVIGDNPLFRDLADTLENAVARPSTVTGEKYNEASAAFWNGVHATLSGSGDAATNLAAVERELIRMSRGGRRW